MPLDRYYPNRTLCDVLHEMKDCYKTRNFAPLKGLIAEAQLFGNRMESALYDIKDLQKINEELHKLREEYKELKRKIDVMKEELGEEDGTGT